MNALSRCILLLVMLLASGAAALAQRDTITILHINDTHSNLMPSGPRAADLTQTRGGFARMTTVIDRERAADPEALFFHAGDTFIGDLFFNTYLGVPEYQYLDILGLNAMTLGNHEFDLTPASLLSAIDAAAPSFAFICSNLTILDTSVGRLKAWVFADTIFDVKGRSVGVFGLTTPEANLLSAALPQAFLDTALGQIAGAEVQSLRARGCDVVVMLSHLGLQMDQAIVTGVAGIDAVVSGHDHALMTTPLRVRNPVGTMVPIVQAGAFYSTVGKLRLLVQNTTVSFLDWTPIALDATVDEEPGLAAYLELDAIGVESIFGFPAFSETVTTLTQTVDEVPGNLLASGPHDTPVGNLVTDAFRDFTKTDIAITAGGSTAQPLYKGPIVPNDIMRMIGYGFNEVNFLGYRIVSFEVNGAAIIGGLEFGVSQIELGDEFLIQGANISYTYDPSKPVMGRLLPGQPRINGQAVDPARRYSVTANEFVFSIFESITRSLGLDTLSNIRTYNDLTEFQVVYDYLKKNPSYTPVRRTGPVAPVAETVSAPRSVLLGNLPNPVRATTDIVFALPERSSLTITVFDLQGREIARVLDGVRDAGRNTVRFDASALTPGVYLYTLRSGAITETQRMIKIR